MTVVGWDTVAPGEYFKPQSGNRFVAADVVLVNLRDEAVETIWYTFTCGTHLIRRCRKAQFPVTLAGGTILAGGLAAGERTRGKVGYEVPETDQEFSLKAGCLNYDDGSKEEMIVDLGSKPVSAEAPGLFTG